MGKIQISGRFVGDAYMRPVAFARYIALPGWLQRAVNDRPYKPTRNFAKAQPNLIHQKERKNYGFDRH